MLRRPATTIALTSADLDAYEANRQRKAWEQQQAQHARSSNGVDKGKEWDAKAATKHQQRSQKDRIMGGGQSRQDTHVLGDGGDVTMRE